MSDDSPERGASSSSSPNSSLRGRSKRKLPELTSESSAAATAIAELFLSRAWVYKCYFPFGKYRSEQRSRFSALFPKFSNLTAPEQDSAIVEAHRIVKQKRTDLNVKLKSKLLECLKIHLDLKVGDRILPTPTLKELQSRGSCALNYSFQFREQFSTLSQQLNSSWFRPCLREMFDLELAQTTFYELALFRAVVNWLCSNSKINEESYEVAWHSLTTEATNVELESDEMKDFLKRVIDSPHIQPSKQPHYMLETLCNQKEVIPSKKSKSTLSMEDIAQFLSVEDIARIIKKKRRERENRESESDSE